MIEAPIEAEIVHDIPADLAALIGQIIAAYAKLEHKLSAISSLLLQLNKHEWRIALRAPRAVDRLDMALDLFAIKDIEPGVDADALRELVTQATSKRDMLAHGLWLQHPTDGTLYLRLTRGNWPKDTTNGDRVSRAVFPQSLPYGVKECRETLALIVRTLEATEALGAEVDRALLSFPERFRPPAPVLNPLGSRSRKGKKPPA